MALVVLGREYGETREGDAFIRNARRARLPLVTFSVDQFERELRMRAKREAQSGDTSLLLACRLLADLQIMRLLPEVDLDVLLGYMWICSARMCQKRTMINLHPALPDGPKGTYRDVIAELIKTRTMETGVMMHLVTPELDLGPAVSYCRVPLEDCWKTVSASEAIRSAGVARELPFVLATLKAFAQGQIKKGQEPLDLTEEINVPERVGGPHVVG